MKDLESRYSVLIVNLAWSNSGFYLVKIGTSLPPLLECDTFPQNMDFRDALDNLYFLFPISLFFCWFTVPGVKTSNKVDCYTKRHSVTLFNQLNPDLILRQPIYEFLFLKATFMIPD